MLSATSKVSIVVPTLNRSDFVVRLLTYYRDNGFRGRILIGDSSGEAHVAKVRSCIAGLGGSLDVVHELCAGMDTSATLKRLNDLVTTPYVAYTGDDDYLVPQAVEKSVRFLEANADYVAAQGRGRTFDLDGAGAYGQMRITERYPLRGFEEQTAAARFTWHMLDYSVTIFALHRTDVWRKMWAALDRVPDRAFGAELLPACLSVVYGKLKLFTDLYLLRQSHPGTYHLPGFLDWIASPAWGPSFQIFVDTLAVEISQRDGTSRDEAALLVKRMFHTYLYANRNSLSYRAQRFRMNLATRLVPTRKALERNLPAPAMAVVRFFARLAFSGPFIAASLVARAPFWLLQKLEHAGAKIKDAFGARNSVARRAAENSTSSGESVPHA